MKWPLPIRRREGKINHELLSRLGRELEARYSKTEGTGHTFIHPDDVQDVLQRNHLRELFSSFSWYNEDNIGPLYEHMRLIICILVVIRWANWELFYRYFFYTTLGFTPRYTDEDLPISKHKFLEQVPPEFLDSFLSVQYTFKPVFINEDSHLSYITDHRLPFLQIRPLPEVVGAQGVIEQVRIERRFLHHANGTANQDPQVMACKRITARTPRGKLNFDAEQRILAHFKLCINRNENIMQSFASFIHGSDFIILSDWADGRDLNLFLTQPNEVLQNYVTSSIRFSPDNLLTEAYNLARALNFLHREMVTKRGKQLRCAHLDLKPENVLVFFPPEARASEAPVGRWKISEFGLSKVEEAVTENRVLPIGEDTQIASTAPGNIARDLSFQPHTRGAETFQPPEVQSTEVAKVNTRRDVWSYGGILAMVLAFALRGPGEVEAQSIRRSIGETTTFIGAKIVPAGRRDKKWIEQAYSLADDHHQRWIRLTSDLILKLLDVNIITRPEIVLAVDRLRTITRVTKIVAGHRLWSFDDDARLPEPIHRPLSESSPGQLESDTLSPMRRDYCWIGGALELTEAVWKLRKNKLGEDHPDTLTAMNNLAVRYGETGRRTEALEIAKAVLKLRKNKLGEEHPDTVTSMHNLALRYRESGQRSEAVELMESLVKSFKNTLGKGHPDTLAAMHNLAITYSEAGQQTEVLQLKKELIELVKLRKNRPTGDRQDDFDERPFVDSAYGTASDGQFHKIALLSTAEIRTMPNDIDDACSEYSNLSIAESEIDLYLECLADDLFSAISSLQPGPLHSKMLCKLLPDFLKEFALRIGLETNSKEGSEMMVFVHKYRERVAEFYEQRFLKESKDRDGSPKIPVEEKVTSWLIQKSAGGDEDQKDSESIHSTMIPPQEVGADATLLEGPMHEFSDEQHDWKLSDTFDNFDKYRGFITETSAYKWLLTKLGQIITQAAQEDDLLKTVHDNILKCLQPLPRLSSRKRPDPESLIFKVDWNPISFILEQRFSENPETALQNAITLTGSPIDAQALSCVDYLDQTWPSSGKQVALLLLKHVGTKRKEKSQAQFNDGSVLTAWGSPSSIYVKVVGSRSSIAEIGEQLAWLGAALRSSPYDGLAYCWPYIDDSPWATKGDFDSNFGIERVGTKALRISFCFEEEHLDTDQNVNGRCWHRLFRNPVLVRGFPILRRCLHESGLELPLNMIAELVGVSRAHVFNDVVFIKGFSTMLVPSRQEDDLIVWHVFSNTDGSRISYLESNLPPLHGIGIRHLQTAGHIIGWCSSVKSHAGGRGANYDIERSRLPAAGADCVLEKVSITGGKFITAGFSFSIGIKDVPVHVSRKPYMQKLRWVSSKFIVFWDEEEKRGWLVNGLRALLHLVRASLTHYESDAFKEALMSKSEDIIEPALESQEDYAISILRNERNMKLPIYAEKDEVERNTDRFTVQGLHDLTTKKRYYRLEDRVEEFYEVLEKLIDHQINVTGQAGVKMRARVRKYLEGWDFKDLASDKDPIYPRVATLHALGKGWVDFIRSIQAVTLFGKGFGQIFEPSSSSPCPYWSDLPKGKFYLAACTSDLQQIMETDGDCTASPKRLCNGISWYTPTAAFDSCRCTMTHGANHSDFVQVLWPTRLRNVLPKQEKEPLCQSGAVIFGHNIRFKWKWEDTGDPTEGDPGLESSIIEDDFHDSGLGLTETSGSRQADQSTTLNVGNEMISLSIPQNSGDDGNLSEISRSGPASFENVLGLNAVQKKHGGGNARETLERYSKAGKIVRRLFRRHTGK